MKFSYIHIKDFYRVLKKSLLFNTEKLILNILPRNVFFHFGKYSLYLKSNNKESVIFGNNKLDKI